MLDKFVLMLPGIFLIMLNGWLFSLWTQSGVLLGFTYGLYLLIKSIVGSRETSILGLAFIVILSLFSKMSQISFLVCLVCLSALLIMAFPSSLYKLILIYGLFNCDRMQSPTSSYVSSRSKLPTVDFVFFKKTLCFSSCLVGIISSLLRLMHM